MTRSTAHGTVEAIAAETLALADPPASAIAHQIVTDRSAIVRAPTLPTVGTWPIDAELIRWMKPSAVIR